MCTLLFILLWHTYQGGGTMTITTGLSGHEIYCLNQKGLSPGNIVIGNSVYSLGILRSITTGFKSIVGGELEQVTKLIEEGREQAYKRMSHEAELSKASGITGVTSQLIFHQGNVEFLSIGSTVHDASGSSAPFTTSANGQELFAQMDAGYKPICFAFGNVAYSIGITRGIIGAFKTIARGEIREFSDILNHTRHLALERIVAHARAHGANAVLGINTTIIPFYGAVEMLMIGTASHAMRSPSASTDDIISSDLTNLEMWNLASMGYAPVKLLLGTSVYSLGVIGNISAIFKSFVRGEINELTTLIYDARENSIAHINAEAKAIGADDVVGVKTYVYQLGNGLIEFLAIGTAIKKDPNAKTDSSQLPPQAITVDQDTFYNATESDVTSSFNANLNQDTKAGKPLRSNIFVQALIIIIIVVIYVIFSIYARD